MHVTYQKSSYEQNQYRFTRRCYIPIITLERPYELAPGQRYWSILRTRSSKKHGCAHKITQGKHKTYFYYN